MNKLISFLIIAFIAITTTMSVNAFGIYANSSTLLINWVEVWTWKQIYFPTEVDWVLYFETQTVLENWDNPKRQYYKYENEELIEIEEKDLKTTDYSDKDNWTISERYKQYNYDSFKTRITIDWTSYWPYNYDYIEIQDISNYAFMYKYSKWVDDFYNVFLYNEKKESNDKIDELLDKVFAKIDKKWEVKAKIVYENLINRIDLMLYKNTNRKQRILLVYIKESVLEKIK